jgi:hypothetical protein
MRSGRQSLRNANRQGLRKRSPWNLRPSSREDVKPEPGYAGAVAQSDSPSGLPECDGWPG